HDASIHSFRPDLLEFERPLVVTYMPRVHFDDGVREAAHHGRVQVGSVEKAREHRLARGRSIDRQASELANTVSCSSEYVDFALVQIVGRQAARRIETNPDGS